MLKHVLTTNVETKNVKKNQARNNYIKLKKKKLNIYSNVKNRTTAIHKQKRANLNHMLLITTETIYKYNRKL